jgi:hypothetical protein
MLLGPVVEFAERQWAMVRGWRRKHRDMMV